MEQLQLYQGDCLEVMKTLPDECVDLTVTSPPYDNLRTYNGNIEQWRFESFYKWATSNGYSETLTLDRHDNDGNYEPSNCRWRTVREQTLNTSRNHLIEFGGEIKPLTKWCSEFDINPKTVRDRLSRGWEIEKALKTPPDRRWSH